MVYVLLYVCIMRLKKVNDNTVLDVFIICQKLRHVQSIKKMPYSYVLLDLQSNPPKHPQSADKIKKK